MLHDTRPVLRSPFRTAAADGERSALLCNQLREDAADGPGDLLGGPPVRVEEYLDYRLGGVDSACFDVSELLHVLEALRAHSLETAADPDDRSNLPWVHRS